MVKILDFGLARLQGKTKGDTIALRGEAGVLGTPDYIAPEQSRNIHAADIRSDLYSLGCTFYFVLAGRVPFPGDNAMEKLVKHLTEQPEPLEKLRPDVPPALAAIVRRLMAKDAADRYQTPAELVSELEAWAAERPKVVPATRTTNRPLWLTPPTHASTGRPPTDPHPESTCLLEDIAVFAPSRRQAESSGPSLMEPLWKFPPDEPRRAETHDTMALSRAEDTEEVTAEALAMKKNRPPSPPRDNSDATLSDMAAATAAAPVSAPPGETLPPIDPLVFRLWGCWAGLVQTIIAGSGPGHVNGDDYRTVHALLLQACRAAIAACPIAERRAFYEECLSIAQPWLKLQTFVNSERVMLDSLLKRCRQIEMELNGGKMPWTVRQCLGLALLILTSMASALWYWKSGRLWLPSFFKSIDWDFSQSTLQVVRGFLQTHPSLLMGVIFPLVVVLSISLLLRPPRT